MSVIERRWIQKGYRIFFAIALLICVGGIPAMQKNWCRTLGKQPQGIIYQFLFLCMGDGSGTDSRYKRSIGRWCTAGLSVYGYQKCRDGGE